MLEELSNSVPDDMEFGRHLERWLLDFHGQVKPMSPEVMRKRVNSYLHQEDLYREKVGYLLSRLGEKPARALDVGSSAGGLSVAMALKGIQVDGIEPSAAGVEVSQMRAQRAGVKDIAFQVGVGERLPFPDATFDFAISLAVLEHVQDVAQVTKEVFRVLKPGGFFYAEVPNNLFPFEAHYKMAWLPMMPKSLAKVYVKARGGYPDFLDHLNYMNRFIVSSYFNEAGFTAIQDKYADFLAGKASQERWASNEGRLARMPWAGGLIKVLLGPSPVAWFANRIVSVMAQKPYA
jgi:ubiquinone/menaquinone biosynthesis C-methylase UbiE